MSSVELVGIDRVGVDWNSPTERFQQPLAALIRLVLDRLSAFFLYFGLWQEPHGERY
jgi:hypothetical protein